uniref:DUF2357 domain-containing protein n=1 Tax=Marinomonas sp. (strain MWYL1) TaxID=400668 RepID=A6W3I8_MARMS
MAKNTRETLYLKHDDFELYVSCESLRSPRSKLERTYLQRGVPLPDCESIAVLIDGNLAQDNSGAADELTQLTQPFFFENRQYWFDIEFASHVLKNSPSVSHKYRLIEDSFSPSPRRNTLQAMLNFGNDVGKCVFHINYETNEGSKSVPVQFTIFATKMVVNEDLGLMNQKIDEIYPFWRYAISGKTTQSQGKSIKKPEKFELFWLAQFERLATELNQGLKRIINAPHNRLQSFDKDQKLDRINKKVTAKQQELAKELIAEKRSTRRMRIGYKRLHVDTPENRFIKMVLKRIKTNLAQLIQNIENEKETKVSESFLLALKQWRQQIGKVSQHQLWREVGTFEGLSSDSKVLQQGAGYSKVYKVWQQLKYYLNQDNGESQLSIKSVADIYEVWCFIEVMSIVKSLGFIEKERTLNHLKQVQFEKHFPDDEMAAAFVYFRASDGMTIELAHEPSFTPKGMVNRTWLAKQRPDIVLRVTLVNHESFFILFDAKYRIDTQQLKDKDGVPEDALNQMHRYRDAIIHQHRFEYESPLKSRPVMGAFALYPGFFNNQKDQENPYEDAIKEIGIGAFALLPSKDSEVSHNHWLRDYLTQKIGDRKAEFFYSPTTSNDYYFVEDAARITPYGVNTVRHNGLTMIAPINEIERDGDYLAKARTGKLQGYHTQLVATNRQNVHRNIVREIRYVIVTVREKNTEHQVGKYLYRVANVKLLPRHDIDRSLTGKESTDNRHYWLFEFVGSPSLLSREIEKPYVESFEFKLTKAEYLQQFKHWGDVKDDLQLYADFTTSW